MPQSRQPVFVTAKLFVWAHPREYSLYSRGAARSLRQTISLANRQCSFTIDHFFWKRKGKFTIPSEKIIMSQYYVNYIM